MSSERWSDETRDMLAGALYTQNALDSGYPEGYGWDEIGEDERDDWRRMTDGGLTALADAGLLVEPGGETREEWGVRYPDLHAEPVNMSDHYGPPGDEAQARRTAEHDPARTLLRRTVRTSPWREAQ